MKRILSLALVAVVAVAAGIWYMNGHSGQTEVNAASAQEVTDGEAAEIDTSSVQEMVMGEEDAPIEMIEYGSFTCPHCASFANNVFPQLKKDYIDTGKVKFVFREVYFDKYGMWASMIARCEPSKFWGINEMIFEAQSDWARKDSEVEIANALRKIGLLAGLDKDKINSCLEDSDKLRTLVAWYQQNAKADDVSATPTFVVDGETMSNMGYSDMKAMLDEKLAE